MGEIVWTAVGTRNLHESAQVKKVGNKYLIMIERTNWSYQIEVIKHKEKSHIWVSDSNNW